MNLWNKLFMNGPENKQQEKWSEDDYSSAALNIIHGKLSFLNDVSASMDGGNQRAIDNERANIAATTEWANNLTDKKLKKAVFGWIDFARDGLKEYEHEFTTHEDRLEFQEWQKKQAEQDNKVANLTKELRTKI